MNGGFEEENICTEYEKNCAPEGWISTSLQSDYYFDDPAYAYEGGHFVGLVLADAGRPHARNFIRTRILCGLRKGAAYRVHFSIRSQHNVFDSIGVYFSSNDFLYQKEKLRNVKPQFFLGDEKSFSPSREWQKISFTYTATGEENFISIGDFKKRGHSLPGRPDLGMSYYFFLDSIGLEPLNPAEHICTEVQTVKEEEYSFNVRHTLLEKLVYVYSKNPPPVAPAPKTVVQRVDTLIIPDVLFSTNSYALEKGAKEILDAFAGKVNGFPLDSVVVEGHTDNKGALMLNQKLSQDRAFAVVQYLQPYFSKVVLARAYASKKPVADNRTAEGRQKNRRVEIYLYVRE